MKKIFLILPIILLTTICLFFLLYILLEKNPNKPPSALLNKDLPKFSTKSLFSEYVHLSLDNIIRNVDVSSDQNPNLSSSSSEEKYTLINFFASWCAPCRAEHKFLFEIKKNHTNLFLLGIAHKDEPDDSKKYLKDEGNPYSFVGLDKDGKIGFDFGVFGLPETFIVNNKGKIIFKHTGPLTRNIIENEIEKLF